jgi:hypothetical protein
MSIGTMWATCILVKIWPPQTPGTLKWNALAAEVPPDDSGCIVRNSDNICGFTWTCGLTAEVISAQQPGFWGEGRAVGGAHIVPNVWKNCVAAAVYDRRSCVFKYIGAHRAPLQSADAIFSHLPRMYAPLFPRPSG